MWRTLPASLLLALTFLATPCLAQPAAEEKVSDKEAEKRESLLLSDIRQLTFAGRRSGEGYFSADGSKLVFQSERKPGNPFFQIYLMDLETGDQQRISPGTGKTTCAWIHPDNERILFASTHKDPKAEQKQQEELEKRESGEERRYSWDYDPNFDLFAYNLETEKYQQLTTERGYDAEGSYSPDGKLIAFASNREAYDRELSDEEKEQLKLDPAYFMEIYIMNADGSNVRKLTDTPGYDGGPFFSPDGQRICWRRFSENGATAEIMTMNIDGSAVRQLTDWQVMSWAPFYHPSGKYLIFTTNRHGFSNFELYLVPTGGGSPVRVTHTDGFDGLPAFHPDGNKLVWTSKRSGSDQSQLYQAKWNHEAALEVLGLSGLSDEEVAKSATSHAAESAESFEPADIARHVNFLCREELAGRLTGTEGEKLATRYVATYFDELGLEPGGDDGSWFQEFEFTAGIDLGDKNRLQVDGESLELNKDWRPVAFSANGMFTGRDYAFAGYGLVTPESKDVPEYDSYVHLDVKDKWVIVFRFLPEEISPEQRQQWARYSSLRYKAMVARDRGAKGLIVVSGPNSQVKNELIKLSYDGSLAGTSLPIISVTDEVATRLMKGTGKTLQEWQSALDTGEPVMGFTHEGKPFELQVEIEQVKRTGRNVIGVLPGSPSGHPLPAVLVGAHVDHLGKGGTSSSLATEDEEDQIHYGADDNASGTAAMLEIAEYLSNLVEKDKIKLQRDVVFAAWSGEELGLYGSNHYADKLEKELKVMMRHFGGGGSDDKRSQDEESAEEDESEGQVSLQMMIAACLNMDMVGRFDENLILQGVGSSSDWKRIIEQRNVPVGLPLTLQSDSYIPTDASVFFMKGVPILSAFTGTHQDYHTPRDTPEKLNYEKASEIARLMGLITRGLATSLDSPDFVSQQKPEEQRRANLRAYLGTIPDYAAEVTGVKLSGVGKDGPADKAGLQGDDIVIELAGKKIENIYDYTYAIEALKIGESVKVVIKRNGEKKELEITPGSRN